MLEHSFNNKTNCLETNASGILLIEEIIQHYDKIAMDDSLPRILKVLIDTKGTQFDINIRDMRLPLNAVKKAVLKYKCIKESMIVDEPFSTAIAMTFEEFGSEIDAYEFKVFNTYKAARDWLL